MRKHAGLQRHDLRDRFAVLTDDARPTGRGSLRDQIRIADGFDEPPEDIADALGMIR